MANFTISEEKEYIKYEPSTAPIATVVLFHGAGAGNQHDFMQRFAKGLCENNVLVFSVNFPYMQIQYETNKKRPPNTNKVLQQFASDFVRSVADGKPIFLAGKSMGGRVSTQIESVLSDEINGVVVLGYPFIPPGKPEKLADRTAHFSNFTNNVLILQGERDTFGNRALLDKLSLPSEIDVQWIENGDHSFQPLKRSGITFDQNMHSAILKTMEFINGNA
jgi:predicted alpha/beta-hydrolase family hydrolase